MFKRTSYTIYGRHKYLREKVIVTNEIVVKGAPE